MRGRSLSAYVTTAALGAGVLLPLLALLPFGWLWLWERGYVLYWFAAALATSLIVFGARLLLLRRLQQGAAAPTSAAVAAADGSPREIAARQAVEQMAATVDPASLESREALLAVAVETIEAVARHMHPKEKDPLWNFTVPEALALIERVSRRLRPRFIESVPLGDQLTIAQAIRLYSWRSVIDTAEKAYDVWRVIRMLNPLTAVTSEIRERLSKAAYEGLRDELTKRLAAAYVREVGRAAIDLYSGRLRVSEEELGQHVSAATREDRAAPAMAEPLRFLLAGQVKAGKSSLINALAAEVRAAVDALPATSTFTSYAVQKEGAPEVLLIDSPGIEHGEHVARIAEKAAECDLLIWVVAANRADRELDRAGIAAVRAHFAAQPKRRLPPMLLVVTHIDRLRPIQEWSPPYDVAEPGSDKARAIRAAMDAAAEDIGVPLTETVPVCLAAQLAPYNVDVLWARVIDALPSARSAQLLRCISEATPGFQWRRLIGQAVGAGRLVAGALVRGPR